MNTDLPDDMTLADVLEHRLDWIEADLRQMKQEIERDLEQIERDREQLEDLRAMLEHTDVDLADLVGTEHRLEDDDR